MKATSPIALLTLAVCAALAVSSCEDAFADKRFDLVNAHVRFEYWEGLPVTQQEPGQNPLDTAALVDGEAIPAVVSVDAITETITADFSIDATGGLQAGTHFELTNKAGEAIRQFRFQPGVFYDSIYFQVIDLTGQEGLITLTLTDTSDPRLSLGMPGPLEERRRFTIEVNP